MINLEYLSGRVPNVEPDGATVGVKDEGVDLHSQGGHVFLLELTSQMPLHECGFAWRISWSKKRGNRALFVNRIPDSIEASIDSQE